jgi:hypothetical protein
MKAVLSQTIFAGAAHIHAGRRVVADLDSNGWPQTGRNKALAVIRQANAVMIGGDQHLATVIHHGIKKWGDAGYSFCVPSISNHYPRKWFPLEKSERPIAGPLKYTDDYYDGFGNKITMLAYANPWENILKGIKDKVNDGTAGYGIIRFNKKKQMVTFECWPRLVDVTQPNAKQFVGWPITVHLENKTH